MVRPANILLAMQSPRSGSTSPLVKAAPNSMPLKGLPAKAKYPDIFRDSGVELPADMTDAEFFSFYATVINRIAYASLEAPKMDSDDKVSFDILWCPHQDHYKAFDCRIQRYFVRGMIEAAREHARLKGWEVRFDSTIPAGAKTCHFTMWKPNNAEAVEWNRYSKQLEEKALERHRTGAEPRAKS